MYESTQEAMWGPGIDLAQEADFDIGALRIRPARCVVEWGGVSHALQRRVMQVLVALARARGAVVSQSDLVARCWSGLSVSDDAIYRCISKLRKLAADFPDPPYEIEAIPGVGYRLTSAPAPEETATVELENMQKKGFRLRAFAAVAVLLVVVCGAALWMLYDHAPNRPALRVAVQPFETLSDSAGARSLSRTIPNKIVDVLGDSQIETVLAGEQAKGDNSAYQSPGLMVTGIVRDDGRNTIVDLRLEDGGTRAALWSTEFRRDSQKASDLPLEVAARIADAVNMIDFARNANPPLTDDSALTAVIQTNDMLRGANDDAWAPMLQKAQDIVARHPEFAFGHSQLAAAYAWASETANGADRVRTMRDAARREANLTLKLDPEDAGAYVTLSGLVAPYDHRGREAILLRGVKNARHPKQPLAGLFSYEGLLLGDVGRLRDALAFQLVAHAKDEWGPARTTKLADSYASMGDFNAARNALQKAVQLWPNHQGVWKRQQYIAGFYEQPSDALAVFKLLDARSSLRASNAIWRGFIEAKAARSQPVTAATSLEIREAADRATISRETEIMMLAALGETKQAIDVANAALDSHQPLETWVFFTPVTPNIRRDANFIPLAKRMGLVEYWRETRKWPDFCVNRTPECGSQLLAAIRPR